MSKKDRLLQEIGTLRETRKDWFMVLFTLASAIAVLGYAVLSGDKPIYVLVLGAVGFMAFFAIAIYYKGIESQLGNKLSELEKEE
ncbi:MAG: hypothetical protein KAZ85_00390 [Gammaproteobacteria bacterium]|nr:hypothetical protein [Gammaproteobacteria bacterium]